MLTTSALPGTTLDFVRASTFAGQRSLYDTPGVILPNQLTTRLTTDELSLVVLTPLFEEIAFRGLIFGWARQRLGFVESALFSALVFAAFHSAYIDNLGPFWGLRAMAMIFTLGFLSALLFERTGSLIAPTALHALFNVQAVMPLLTEQPAA